MDFTTTMRMKGNGSVCDSIEEEDSSSVVSCSSKDWNDCRQECVKLLQSLLKRKKDNNNDGGDGDGVGDDVDDDRRIMMTMRLLLNEYCHVMNRKEQEWVCQYLTTHYLFPNLSSSSSSSSWNKMMKDGSSLMEALEEGGTSSSSPLSPLTTKLQLQKLPSIWYPTNLLLEAVSLLLSPTRRRYHDHYDNYTHDDDDDDETRIESLLHWLGSRHGIVLPSSSSLSLVDDASIDKYRQALNEYCTCYPTNPNGWLALYHLAMDTNHIDWISQQEQIILQPILLHNNPLTNSTTTTQSFVSIPHDFIYRYHTSRHYADAPTLLQTLSHLTNAIQQQLLLLQQKQQPQKQQQEPIQDNDKEEELVQKEQQMPITATSNNNNNNNNNNNKRQKTLQRQQQQQYYHPKIMIAWIDIATSLFYFLQQHDDEKEEQTLIQQLVHSILTLYCHTHHISILESCANFFSLALAYSPPNNKTLLLLSNSQLSNLTQSTYHTILPLLLSSKTSSSPIHKLSFVLSRLAYTTKSYANSIIAQHFVWKYKQQEEEEQQQQTPSLQQLLPTLLYIAFAQPKVIQSYWKHSIFPSFQSYLKQQQNNISTTTTTTTTTKNKDLYTIILIELSSRLVQNNNNNYDASSSFLTKDSWDQFFQHQDDSNDLSSSPSWYCYKIAIHAYSMNQYHITTHLLQQYVKPFISTQQYYIWCMGLYHAAQAEYIIIQQGIRSIPIALIEFQKAQTRFQQLLPQTQFQCQYIQYRIELFQLLLITCEQCHSIQLTNNHNNSIIMNHNNTNNKKGTIKHNKNNTRMGLHQRNIPHAIWMICNKYTKLYKQYGIFHCQQTRTTLRTLHAMCRFIAELLSKVAFPNATADSTISQKYLSSSKLWPKGDRLHPMMILIHQLRTKLLSELLSSSSEVSMEPRLRATTVLEIIQILLTKVPCPSPRGIATVKSLPRCTNLRIFPSSFPDEATTNQESKTATKDEQDNHLGTKLNHDNCNDNNNNDDDDDYSNTANVLDIVTGETCTMNVTGIVPLSYRKNARIPFYQVLIWYSISYDGPIDDNQDEEEDDEDDEATYNNMDSTSLNVENCAAGPLFPGGKFHIPIECGPIHQEGYYQLKVKLGCRDIRCGEWEIPLLERNDGVVFFCVTSSSS